jgi:hypothetical protein
MLHSGLGEDVADLRFDLVSSKFDVCNRDF